jgi:hypothetical protein
MKQRLVPGEEANRSGGVLMLVNRNQELMEVMVLHFKTVNPQTAKSATCQ